MSENIFLFVPNLIGFARIILALISIYLMTTEYVLATIFYGLSALLDMLDGLSARRYNQSTKFGAILDNLTDRCSTMCLIVVLSNFYPKYMFLLQLSLIIDIAGHWIHIQTSLMMGKTSHKVFGINENRILRIYYTCRPVLTFICAGNELFYTTLYFLHFESGPIMLKIHLIPLIVWMTAPVAVAKAILNLLQGFLGVLNLSAMDVKERQRLRQKTEQIIDKMN